MFKRFEKFINPFAESMIARPHQSFWKFAWGCTKGFRPYLAGMTIFTGLVAAFEALLFAMMGFYYFHRRKAMSAAFGKKS